jgi:hypothetical protein
VIQAGALRKRIARRLTAAYTGGLLSDDTYVRRVEALKAPLIDPFRLVGDLRPRGRAVGQPLRLFRTVGATAQRVRKPAAVEHQSVLLPLDWDGQERELLVGRHEACDVVLLDPSVSRQHARLIFRDGAWILLDLGSTNGTTVNGAPVSRCELRPGDQVTLGNERLTVD